MFFQVLRSFSFRFVSFCTRLPLFLITDLVSRATRVLALSDQAMVEVINSVTLYGANVPLLNPLDDTFGVQ